MSLRQRDVPGHRHWKSGARTWGAWPAPV